jgi:hypothetical protein
VGIERKKPMMQPFFSLSIFFLLFFILFSLLICPHFIVPSFVNFPIFFNMPHFATLSPSLSFCTFEKIKKIKKKLKLKSIIKTKKKEKIANE